MQMFELFVNKSQTDYSRFQSANVSSQSRFLANLLNMVVNFLPFKEIRSLSMFCKIIVLVFNDGW